tara:strand:- start:92 stop:1165 length:1074 start_codon:yes stop_codon:yes gene_type:complete
MYKNNYNVIGVMSGTSLDGVDLAFVNFSFNDKWTFKILKSKTVPYSNEWVNRLKKAIDFSKTELDELNINYTFLLAQIINEFIDANNLKAIDAICSHGHTILHKPNLGYTLQIGNLPILSELTKQNIVYDFRVQDVELGGQGAPLVPIGDRLLFSQYDYCLNLGGFSNISFEKNHKRIAFDISPVNTVLNYYANKQNLPYDDEGLIAKSGSLNLGLFDELNQSDYYKKSYPKSLGVEFVNKVVLPIIESSELSVKDLLNTFVEHVAFQMSQVITKKGATLLISGGGVYNTFLIERITYYLPDAKIILPDHQIIEYKEALIFAFLGVLKLRDEINVLSSVTGASINHSSGKVVLKNLK